MTQAYTSGSAVKTRLGITDTTDDALLAVIVTQVNEWMESYMGRAVGPIAGGTYIFDGSGDDSLYVPLGIRSVTSLTVVPMDGYPAVSIGTDAVMLEPPEAYRRPGWPAFEVELKSVNSSGYYVFPEVEQGVTIVGDFGWAAIPADLADVAAQLAVGKWRLRAAGGADSVTIGLDGERRFERSLGYEERRTLDRYRVDPVGIG